MPAVGRGLGCSFRTAWRTTPASRAWASRLWLLLRGELPDAPRARLLEAALVASVDHGPQAPAIAIARSAVSCGLPL